MLHSLNDNRISALIPYLTMKTSLEKFGKIASELDDAQKQTLSRWVDQQIQLHQAVLSSTEATQVSISSAQITHAFVELESRFNTSEDFEKTLDANHLTREDLTSALSLELHSQTVLDYISHDIVEFTDEQARSYYTENKSRFEQPERRKASHILITINDEFAENRREPALKRLTELSSAVTPATFGSYAERHSECPTAMNSGQLGMVEKGLLHKELDEYLFSMTDGEISPVLETEAGFHLLYCEQIMPAHCVSFDDAKGKIIEKNNQRARVRKQKQWISGVMKG